MTASGLDLLRAAVRRDPDERCISSELDQLERMAPGARWESIIRIVAELSSLPTEPALQTRSDRRQIAGLLPFAGRACIDVTFPDGPGAFADVRAARRPVAIAMHLRLRSERDFDALAPLLTAAAARVRDDDSWFLLLTALDTLTRSAVELGRTDRRRFRWYGTQLYQSWLGAGDVAGLIQPRWLSHLDLEELERWWKAVPMRRPLLWGGRLDALVTSGPTR